MKLEEIKEFNRKLTALLDDPQEGAASWNMFLGDLIEKFIKSWLSS
jgi:hypothetical protein